MLPVLARVLGTAPNAFDGQLLSRLNGWRASGSSRIDSDGDGKIDAPGAAIMDAAWPRIADAAVRPRVGALTDRLKTLIGDDDPASADATKERLTFRFLPLTACWTNRPTFQQVITFTGHRPR